MQNRIRPVQHSTTGTAQADEALRRVRHTSQPATGPLPPIAEGVLRRLELAFAPQIVANFDYYGSLWGFDTAAKAEADFAETRAEGGTVEEWNVTDRNGQPLRIVRTTAFDTTFLGGVDIAVFSTWSPYAKAVA